MSVPSRLTIFHPAIRPPILSLAKSSPVNIFTTPGALEAFDMLTFDIVALACGERTKYGKFSRSKNREKRG